LVIGLAVAPSARAAPSEQRFALVIGNGSYQTKTLPTAVNDAALVAQTLQAAGFDVTGVRDLNGDMLRQSFGDFFAKVKNAGPDVVVAIYFAGLGLQLDGENYLLPIDAEIAKPSDLRRHALALSEQMDALAALHVKAAFVIVDAARPSPFLISGQPPASGLAWTEPEANTLVAFNAAPGTDAPDSDGKAIYGPYALALVEMIREGGLPPATLFDRVRLRVNQLTDGAQVPWDASTIQTKFTFLARGPGAPPRADSPERTAWMRAFGMRKLSASDAYWTALLRDTFDGYAEFVAQYWHGPVTARVLAMLAARREALTWQRTRQANVPEAYWTYLERYPRGPHRDDAQRLLRRLGAATAVPASFKRKQYDVPPPLPDELDYVEQAVLIFSNPSFGFAPLQAVPAYFLEPQPPELRHLAQPVDCPEGHGLPDLAVLPLPAHVRLPAGVLAPPKQLVVASEHSAMSCTQNVRLRAANGRMAQPSRASPALGGANGPSVKSAASLIYPSWVTPIAPTATLLLSPSTMPAETNGPGSPPPLVKRSASLTYPSWVTPTIVSRRPVSSARHSSPPSASVSTASLSRPLSTATRKPTTAQATARIPLPIPRRMVLSRPPRGSVRPGPLRAEQQLPALGPAPRHVVPSHPPIGISRQTSRRGGGPRPGAPMRLPSAVAIVRTLHQAKAAADAASPRIRTDVNRAARPTESSGGKPRRRRRSSFMSSGSPPGPSTCIVENGNLICGRRDR
ncbi:MAG: caspase family protein, partial [Acetobacteraceae bacterium]